MLIVAQNSPIIAFYFKRVTAFIDSHFYFYFFISFASWMSASQSHSYPSTRRSCRRWERRSTCLSVSFWTMNLYLPSLKVMYILWVPNQSLMLGNLFGEGQKMFPLQRYSKQTNRIEEKKQNQKNSSIFNHYSN